MKLKEYLEIKYYNNIFYLLKQNLIGKLIKKGKKIYSWKLFFQLNYFLKNKTKKDSNFLLLKAVINSLIKINFIKIRFGSTKKEIPIFLKFERQIKFAITFLLNYAKTKRMKSINLKRLVNIICFSYNIRDLLYVLTIRSIEKL